MVRMDPLVEWLNMHCDVVDKEVNVTPKRVPKKDTSEERRINTMTKSHKEYNGVACEKESICERTQIRKKDLHKKHD
jgi:hypothetical protein